MFVKHKLRSLIDVDPSAARKTVLSAFVKAKCHRSEAARLLECRAHAFLEWVRLLGLEAQLTKIEARAKREGWHHGRLGGAQLHQDPEERVRKLRQTWARKRKTNAATP